MRVRTPWHIIRDKPLLSCVGTVLRVYHLSGTPRVSYSGRYSVGLFRVHSCRDRHYRWRRGPCHLHPSAFSFFIVLACTAVLVHQYQKIHILSARETVRQHSLGLHRSLAVGNKRHPSATVVPNNVAEFPSPLSKLSLSSSTYGTVV